MRKAILTGSSGFLGSHIKRELLNESFHVSTIGRSERQSTNLALQLPYFDDYEYDKVIHNAGKAHVFPKTPKEEQEFFDVNFTGTENLLKGLEKLSVKPKQFIFISTVAVYGLIQGENINEEYPTSANTPYGVSKKQAESLVIKWCKINNVNHLILRLPLITGVNPPGNLGDMKKAILSGRYIRIINNNARKSVVVADDIAHLIATVSTEKTGIYNLTDRIHPSFNDIESAISYKLQRNIKLSVPLFVIKPLAKIGDLLSFLTKKDMPISTLRLNKILSTLTFDDSLAVRELNWQPKSSIDFIKQNI